MIKKLCAALLAFAMLFSLTACIGEKAPEITEESTTSHVREIKTKVASLNGALGYGFMKLAKDRSYAYDVQFYDDAEQIISLLKSGEADVASLPVEAAAKLYNETNGSIKILAVNTLSDLHVVEYGTTVKSISDLKGKTVYATGKGTTAEYIINHILSENGINPEKDVKIEFIGTPEELASIALKGEAKICILPEPYVSEIIVKTNPQEEETTGETAATTANPNAVKLRNALHITSEWAEICDSPLACGVVVARTDYITANPEIITEFIGFNEVSVNYLTAGPETAALFLVDNGLFDNQGIAMGSLINSNTSYLEREEMKAAVSGVLDVLYSANPEIIGGAVPDENIYYNY